MADFLIESGRRANRLTLMQAMMAGTNAKYEENRRIMGALVSDSESALWPYLCSPLISARAQFSRSTAPTRQQSPISSRLC